jgi:NAD(P)H-dependent FMN reductase
MKILAISGSLRQHSTNTALFIATKAVAPPDITVEIFADLSVLPHFNPDLDHDHPPEPVARFRKAISDAQALIISTPEYAHGIPGVLKNALDWLVRDPDFGGKRIGLIYGSATEASHAHVSLMEILRTMSARVMPKAIVSIQSVRTKIDREGRIIDPQIEIELSSVLKALAFEPFQS